MSAVDVLAVMFVFFSICLQIINRNDKNDPVDYLGRAHRI